MGYKMDFVNDFNEIIKQWFKMHNIQKYSKDDDYILEFLRLYRLHIPQYPRKVYISNELKNSTNFKKYKQELDLIKNTFESGGDIMPFTSKRLKSKTYNDKVLILWNMHHLHLNLDKDENGYVERSDDLLFCMVRDDSVYMVDITNHNDWANIKLLEIVSNNWSELLDEFEYKNIKIKYNQTDYEKCRKKNINHLVSVNGKTLGAFDIGVMSNGTSAEVYMRNIHICRQLKSLQDFFQKEPNINKSIKENTTIKLVCFIILPLKRTLFFHTSENNEIIIDYDDKTHNVMMSIDGTLYANPKLLYLYL